MIVTTPIITNKTNLYLNFRWILECIAILLFTPVIALIVLIVAIILIFDGKSNPFYSQIRIGRYGKQFKLYKFRTMINSSDSYSFNPEQIDNITPICRFLRLHRIDEIPQLLNVLLADMSIIGSRPDPISYHKSIIKEIPEYSLRLIIRPGLTGMAQINVGHTVTVDEAKAKLLKDIEYLNNINIKTDLEIIFKTFAVLLWGNGAK